MPLLPSRKFSYTLATAVSLAVFALQSPARAVDDEGEKIMLAQKIFDMSNYAERTKNRALRYAKATFEEYKTTLKPMDASTQEDLVQKLADAVARDEIALKPQEIKIYADAYTTQELEGIIAFYGSELGQTYLRKSPEIEKQMSQLFYGATNGKVTQHWKDLTSKYQLTAEKL